MKVANLADNFNRSGQMWFQTRLARGRKVRFSDTVEIAPALAAEMLKTNTSNRPISNAVVQKHQRAMEAGAWKLTTEGIVFDRLGRLQNGQHRLTAVVQSGVTIHTTTWFGVEPEEFDYLDQCGVRGPSDLISMAGLNNRNLRATVTRMLMTLEAGKEIPVSAVDVKNKAIEFNTELMDVAISAGMSSRKIVTETTGTLTYYWISTRTSHPQKLPGFWKILTTGIGMSDGDPITKIRDPLMLNEITSSSSRQSTVKRSAAIIHAWNATVSNRRRFSFDWPHVVILPEVK